MNELQTLLGEAYKENMTIEEIGAFFEGKKFADLSTGNYVDKDKFENQVNDLNNKLQAKEKELNAKLTDEEKSAKASKEQAERIKELEQLLKDNTVNGNKNVVNNVLQSSRDILGIQSADDEFTTFVDNITTEDSTKTNAIANYVAKVIKDSYEKGKKDATKDAMGEFGKNKGQSSNKDEPTDEIGKLGKELASLQNKKPTYDYFK